MSCHIGNMVTIYNYYDMISIMFHKVRSDNIKLHSIMLIDFLIYLYVQYAAQ